MRPSNRSVLSVLLLLLGVFFSGLAGPQSQARAAGHEVTLSGSDLTVDINSKWAGGTEGGYYPVRFKIRNLGPARTITLMFTPMSAQKVPMVSRTLTLGQNVTVNTSLLIPLVSYGNFGDVQIMEKGRLLKMQQSISLPDSTSSYERGPEMLIVSTRLEDGQYYSEAANRHFNTAAHHHSSHSSSSKTENVTPGSLPANWLAYTTLDILAIPWPVFEKELNAETRQALLQWVDTGGTLLIYQTQQNQAALDQLLGWDRRKHVGKAWQQLDQKQFLRLDLPDPADSTVQRPETLEPEYTWKLRDDLVSQRSFGLGRVVRFTDNPFPGTVSHWTWLIRQLDNGSLMWSSRNGFNARTGNSTFLHFMIPGVGSVPVVSFLVLITIFTVVIGPLNYGYFLRKKQLAMLLVTVPLLAFGSSGLLLGYSTIANGFSVKSRIRSVTLLDQSQKSSLSISRVAYFAGATPSGGMTLDPNTAVYPIWPTQDSFDSGRVNWSDTQNLQAGWLRSRTRTQFLMVTHRDQRGRLDLKKTGAETQVLNGLEWPLKQLFLADSAGKLWFAENLKPGGQTTMRPVENADRAKLREFLADNTLSLPDDLDENQAQRIAQADRYNSYSYRYGYGSSGDSRNAYHQSLQERLIQQIQQMDETAIQPGQYYAVLDGNPGLDLGVKKPQERESLHLLIGFME